MTPKEMRHDLKEAFKVALKPLGFRIKGCEFHRTVGDVMQIVRIETLPGSNASQWLFRITEGATTARLQEIAFRRLVESANASFGPLYHDAWLEYSRDGKYFNVKGEHGYFEVKCKVVDLLKNHILPFVSVLTNERAIVDAARKPGSTNLSGSRCDEFIQKFDALMAEEEREIQK